MARSLALLSLLVPLLLAAPAESPTKLAERYAGAVRTINEKHARKPGDTTEEQLSEQLPSKARAALASLLEEEPPKKDPESLGAALLTAGEAALDLDRLEDFERVRARLSEVDPARAAELGTALSRPRFLLRGIGAFEEGALQDFGQVLERVLEGYDEVFGFEEFSKLPGKKLRVRLHLEQKIERPPHFAPQFPFHSEIDFPTVFADRLSSPTGDGKFLFYGLCHELGHVIAMWGARGDEQDHHAWAHYTGVVLVEHLSAQDDLPPAFERLKDARWRSLAKLREELQGIEPSLEDRSGVLALLVGLHDLVGPRALGDAIDHLDAEDRRLRINHVRYYTFRELRDGLEEVLEDRGLRKQVAELLD